MMDVNTIHYFPNHIGSINEFKEISRVYDIELRKAWADLDQEYRNRFFDTMDEATCIRQEKLLGISINPDDSLDDRRRRIKGYYASDLPYTKLKLDESLKAMCGADLYHLSIDTTTGMVTVGLELESLPMLSIVKEILQRMTPAGMEIKIYVIYNRQSNLKQYTHAQLKAYTHDQLRNSTDFSDERRLIHGYIYEKL